MGVIKEEGTQRDRKRSGLCLFSMGFGAFFSSVGGLLEHFKIFIYTLKFIRIQ